MLYKTDVQYLTSHFSKLIAVQLSWGENCVGNFLHPVNGVSLGNYFVENNISLKTWLFTDINTGFWKKIVVGHSIHVLSQICTPFGAHIMCLFHTHLASPQAGPFHTISRPISYHQQTHFIPSTDSLFLPVSWCLHSIFCANINSLLFLQSHHFSAHWNTSHLITLCLSLYLSKSLKFSSINKWW